jgi:hypothetical protein
MRCFGTERQDTQNRQVPSRVPSKSSKKLVLTLTKTDLEAFQVWKRCSDDADRARPVPARTLNQNDAFIAAAKLKFSDGSEHFGGLEITNAPSNPAVKNPFLLRDGERINFQDLTTAGYTFIAITPRLAEELHRKFLQNQARLERQIGRPLQGVFPIHYELQTEPRIVGVLEAPKFELPRRASNEA